MCSLIHAHGHRYTWKSSWRDFFFVSKFLFDTFHKCSQKKSEISRFLEKSEKLHNLADARWSAREKINSYWIKKKRRAWSSDCQGRGQSRDCAAPAPPCCPRHEEKKEYVYVMYMHIYVFTYICVYTYIYIFISIYVCVYIYICMYVYEIFWTFHLLCMYMKFSKFSEIFWTIWVFLNLYMKFSELSIFYIYI